jgi:hypothetical protein
MRALLFPALLFVLAGRGLLGSEIGPATGPSARAASGEESALLLNVLHQTADDLARWAYTEHRVVRTEKGKVKSQQVVRFDPSLPYAEQWTPIEIDGREPSARDLARFRRRGEESDPASPKLRSNRRSRPALGEVIDAGRAFVAEESATHWVFEIPLLKLGNERFPPEKFQVHARVRKEGERLETIVVGLRESFRSKVLVKVKSGEGTIEFAQVDPKYPPTMVAVSGDASASVLFVSIGGSVELKRTDLRHVRLFDERFEVQIGSLKAIDF